MRIAYLDCSSGISGDMTLAALVDVGVDLAALQTAIDSLGLPSCRLVATDVKKRGFRATHIQVAHEPEHAHRHLHHIEALIDRARLTDNQRTLAKKIFHRIAEAEAKVHGTTIQKVHFHEVGAVDSIADIVGAAVGWDLLGVEQVICSPIPTGTGFIEIAHGRCALPAPATAELLVGVPLMSLAVEGELTTPTGAAIATTLAHRFGPLPGMRVDRIGYGAGTHDFPQPNILRLFVGDTNAGPFSNHSPESARTSDSISPLLDSISLLETNLDDASGEVIGHAVEVLLSAGALDVSTTAIQMKKGRPGVLLAVQCRHEDVDQLQALLFDETSAFGVRRSTVERRVLPRRTVQVKTRFGTVDGMVVQTSCGGQRFSPEFESCRRLAKTAGVALHCVYEEALAAFLASDIN